MCDMASSDNRKVDLMIQESPFSLYLLTWSYPQEKKNLGKKIHQFLFSFKWAWNGKGDIVSVYLDIDMIRYPVVGFILKYFAIKINQNNLLKIQFLSTK